MKILLTLFLAGFISVGSVSRAVEPTEQNTQQHRHKFPLWGEFQGLLGKPIEAKEVQEIVALYRLKKYAKGDSGGFSNYGEMPFSLLFGRNKIERVVVKIANSEGESRPVYISGLPFDIDYEDRATDVIRRLGNPEIQSTDGWLLYKKLGLWLTFNKRTGKLSEIDLDDPARWKE